MYETTQAEAPGLEEYLRALRSRWWVVLLAMLIGLIGASLFASSRTASYEASAKVTLGPTPSGGSLNQPVAPDTATEADKLKSTAVAQLVHNQTGSTASANDLLGGLTVTYLAQRNVLDLTYASHDPAAAQKLVNAFATEYSAKREAEAKSIYATEIARLQAESKTLTDQVTALNAQKTPLVIEQSDLGRTSGLTDEQRNRQNALPGLIQNYDSQINAAQLRLATVQNNISDAQRAADTRQKAAEVTREATLPTTAVGVSNKLLKIAGLMLGLIAGMVAAFTLARLDHSATDASKVEEAAGAPVLANVPAFRWTRSTGVNALVMVTNGRSLRMQRARESYRRLRTSLQLIVTKSGRNSIVVTSAHPSEGKSVTAANLAIANAQAGKRTVLVSADLRRPSIERLLSVPNDKGLSDWLAEETEAVVQELPSIPNLSVIVAGNQLDGPGELLASPRLASLIQDLEAEYELVILDTPPVLATADAATVAGAVGGVLFVVDGRRTDLEVLQLMTAEISRSGGRVLGAVMNRTKSQPGTSMLRRDAYAYEREARKRLD